MQEDFLVFIKTIFTFNKSLRHLSELGCSGNQVKKLLKNKETKK